LNLPEIKERANDRSDSQMTTETPENPENIKKDDLDGLDEEESAIVSRLSGEPVHVDDLCRQSGMTIATITSMLTLLELKGKVSQVGAMHYVRASAAEVTHGS
jgi:DNA processing protein